VLPHRCAGAPQLERGEPQRFARYDAFNNSARCQRQVVRCVAATRPIISSSRCVSCYHLYDSPLKASDHRITRTDRLLERALETFGRDDHPFALHTHLDTRSPAFHRDDACAVDAGASPNVDITSALHAVRFDARPCMIGSSIGAMRAESLSGLLCTGARRRIERLLHLNVVLPRPITGAHRSIAGAHHLNARSPRGHGCDRSSIRLGRRRIRVIASPPGA
jgi:hypothetical protein